MEKKKPMLRAVEQASSHTGEVCGGRGEWAPTQENPEYLEKHVQAVISN